MFAILQGSRSALWCHDQQASRHHQLVEVVILAVLLFGITYFALQPVVVLGSSMEPSLHTGEHVLVDKWSYWFHAPARGDVIVFAAPTHPSQDYIKRIIALPGDQLTIDGATVIVNGVQLHERYVDPRLQGNPFPSFRNRVVPPDSYFVLGDNRAGSSDSRQWGFVRRQSILGQATLVYWPVDQHNLGLLPDVSATFANIG